MNFSWLALMHLLPYSLGRMSYQPINVFTGMHDVSLVEALLLHLHRRLLFGATTLRVEAHRGRLLAVKRGKLLWTEVDAWRKELYCDFERALAETSLRECPDYETANRFLIKARREMVYLYE
jgi:hypothetical protein